MATQEKVKNVTQLDRVEHIDDNDCLVLVRNLDDGSQQAFKFYAKNFRGEDAYQLAVEKYAYAGTYAQWLEDVGKVVAADASINRMITATERTEDINAHPNQMNENGNWEKWNPDKQQYEDTGIVARGGAMYPTFKHKGNKLYIVDYGSNVSERVVKKGNKLVFRV